MAKNAAGADAPSKEEKKAAKVAARAAKKERRGQIWQAFQMQRKQDKRLLPYMIGALVGTTLIVTLALMWLLPWWMLLPFGIILGALTAAILAGKFAPVWKVSNRSLAAAVVGGILLGYGARIAYGCNIGAYFSGIASGSLHGWLWLVAAFAGNVAGTRLRPMFDLAVEKTNDRVVT